MVSKLILPGLGRDAGALPEIPRYTTDWGRKNWWIAETELGRTAFPSKGHMLQGVEVLKGRQYKVFKVRRADPGIAGDAIAVKAAVDEIEEEMRKKILRTIK